MNLQFDSIDELNHFLRWAGRAAPRAGREHETDNRDSYRDAAPVVFARPAEVRVAGRPAALGAAYGDDNPRGEVADDPQDTRTVEDAAMAVAPEVDANGVRYDERIHAPSRSLNADGTWRAKRKVSPDLVAQVLAEQRAEDAADEPKVDEAGDDVVVTETHALPADDRDAANTEAVAAQFAQVDAAAAGEVAQVGVDTKASAAGAAVEGPAGMSIDFPALVANAQVLAEDLAGDMVKVLEVSRAFLASTSAEAFAALKNHVAPDGNGGGKSLPAMTPGERRVLEAAMTLHLAPDASAG